MTTYQVLVDGDVRMTFSADFVQASSPILLEGDSTPFQVADARHRKSEAAELLNSWCRNQGGEMWSDDEEIEIVEVANAD